MSSVNRVILIGNLGAAPESRAFADGSAVCNFSLATTDKWRDKETGDMKEATEWHRIVLYRRLAEVASQYLQKGSQIYISGRLRTRKWTDKTGVERTTTEIEADEMKMLGKNTDKPSMPNDSPQVKPSSALQNDDFDDTIPF